MRQRIEVKPGYLFTAVCPYSEVCMSMRVSGKPMKMMMLHGDYPMVQLYRDDMTHFSFPITFGEAGVYRDDDGTFYTYVEVPDGQ